MASFQGVIDDAASISSNNKYVGNGHLLAQDGNGLGERSLFGGSDSLSLWLCVQSTDF